MIIPVDGAAVQSLVFYTCVLIVKTLFMELLSLNQKLKLSGLPSNNSNHISKKCEVINEKIKRIERARLNDIENIPIFIAISVIYLCTKPEIETANYLFSIFAHARIAHTFVYAVYVIPQPARAIAFITGEVVTWIMIFKCILQFYE